MIYVMFLSSVTDVWQTQHNGYEVCDGVVFQHHSRTVSKHNNNVTWCGCNVPTGTVTDGLFIMSAEGLKPFIASHLHIYCSAALPHVTSHWWGRADQWPHLLLSVPPLSQSPWMCVCVSYEDVTTVRSKSTFTLHAEWALIQFLW